jgi:asparagine synthase (glutamine-hydrolysing)
MCGIAGIFHYADRDHPVDRNLLTRMTRSLAHRGPDAEGFHVSGSLGLGHRRLSIVDLSPTGAQPMAGDDGSCWIVYNGEFYNHRQFRPRLSARGHRFRGSSDTETLLRLMESEGPDALVETAGIFGFAFWNGREESLTLARDHVGVKQVYYHDDGRRIVFASEIKALLQDPSVPREPDPEAIGQYLHFHTALFERTCFRHIKQIRAGEYLRITRYGASIRRYWKLDDFSKAPGPDRDVVANLRETLTSVVGDQLMSDVPVGSFFSGGIDSSAVASYATRAGRKPICFGVHFSGQGVVDERPYQEAAAKALGLDLHLITDDGSTFPEDFRRLMYHQDEPVIGSALFPMSKVSELAARHVKVCLGGQAADEVFGGYARYALGRPLQVLRSWYAGRGGSRSGEQSQSSEPEVGGNLSRQFAQGKTIARLARNARHLANWETSYFEHFARTPESTWLSIFDDRHFCSREQARRVFHETISRSAAADPVDKIMHWDLQTYLTGLFHQDDRMSMSASLESRVPFGDPRVVRFAFRVNPDLKLRAGASKWVLRQAVADVLPELVLNRRKVGFDTPAQRWIAGPHNEFLRNTLLSARARQRGWWNRAGLESVVEHASAAGWFDVIWKVLSLELWASIFLDEAPASLPASITPGVVTAQPVEDEPAPLTEKLTHVFQECRELGVKGTFARGLWEFKTRSGLVKLQTSRLNPSEVPQSVLRSGVQLPFTGIAIAGPEMRRIVDDDAKLLLFFHASEATRGRIFCFSSWTADFGNPIDWHRDPVTGYRWKADAHWSRVLEGSTGQDIKFIWEAGRFPHAYHLARAAVLFPESAPQFAAAFSEQVRDFIRANSPGEGAHWFSGQEVAIRILSWLFGLHVFGQLGLVDKELDYAVAVHMAEAGAHIREHIAYARDSIYNNHLLSEALGLYVCGRFVGGERGLHWVREGVDLLEEHANRQFAPDGAYIQNSHNYHRVALQLYLWAIAFARANGDRVPNDWLAAIERSLFFLTAHQNPGDGRLPNYGANDGSLPLIFSTAHFSDFRPTLQAGSVTARGERIYPDGPWNETALWLCGRALLDVPFRPLIQRSASFSHTGYHVVRGKAAGNFFAFRCGNIQERFSQIDMLHLDVWWRGQNILNDPGSYRYNGAEVWHSYFLRTESHNTAQVDGRDQMLHFRQFKTLYWTEARLTRFEDHPDFAIVEGEHYGFQRGSGCTHRRSVLYAKDDLWIIADHFVGSGNHTARVHWLASDLPFLLNQTSLGLETPEGEFNLRVTDENGIPAGAADVVRASSSPPRGWISRTYAELAPALSFAVQRAGTMPMTFVTLMGAGKIFSSVKEGHWTVSSETLSTSFDLSDGCFSNVAVSAAAEVEIGS